MIRWGVSFLFTGTSVLRHQFSMSAEHVASRTLSPSLSFSSDKWSRSLSRVFYVTKLNTTPTSGLFFIKFDQNSSPDSVFIQFNIHSCNVIWHSHNRWIEIEPRWTGDFIIKRTVRWLLASDGRLWTKWKSNKITLLQLVHSRMSDEDKPFRISPLSVSPNRSHFYSVNCYNGLFPWSRC